MNRTRALTFFASAIPLISMVLSCDDGGSVAPSPPAWQFSGGIIFELNAGSEASGVCAVDPDEAAPKTHSLLQGAREPRVSPDGKSLLQSRRPGNSYDLFISNVDGTNSRNISNTDSFLEESDGDWAPVMDRVVCHVLFLYSFKEAIRVEPLDGSQAFNITDTTRIRTANLPRWSPDGTRIAYLGQDSLHGPWWLTVIAPDGSGERRIGQQWALVPPVWSPDGSKIAYAGSPGQDLNVLDVSSGQNTVPGDGALADGCTVAWLADGRLVYSAHVGDSYVVRVASLMPVLVVSTVASGFHSIEGIVLDPQGDRLAVIGRQVEGELSLYLMALDGSSIRRVATVDPSPQATLPTTGSIYWVE